MGADDEDSLLESSFLSALLPSSAAATFFVGAGAELDSGVAALALSSLPSSARQTTAAHTERSMHDHAQLLSRRKQT